MTSSAIPSLCGGARPGRRTAAIHPVRDARLGEGFARHRSRTELAPRRISSRGLSRRPRPPFRTIQAAHRAPRRAQPRFGVHRSATVGRSFPRRSLLALLGRAQTAASLFGRARGLAGTCHIPVSPTSAVPTKPGRGKQRSGARARPVGLIIPFILVSGFRPPEEDCVLRGCGERLHSGRGGSVGGRPGIAGRLGSPLFGAGGGAHSAQTLRQANLRVVSPPSHPDGHLGETSIPAEGPEPPCSLGCGGLGLQARGARRDQWHPGWRPRGHVGLGDDSVHIRHIPHALLPSYVARVEPAAATLTPWRSDGRAALTPGRSDGAIRRGVLNNQLGSSPDRGVSH